MTLFPDIQALAADQPTGLGTAMAGGKGRLNLDKTPRNAFDYYPTPDECTRALLLVERAAMAAHGNRVWEMCGRGGAIVRILAATGFDVVATDIVADPANCVTAQDVLEASGAFAPMGVTNPPFALAERIIVHLLGKLGLRYLALLLKTQFFQTSSEDRGRNSLYRAYRPSRRYDLNWRVNFAPRRRADGKKSHPTMNVSWFIWDANAPVLPFVPAYLLARDGLVTSLPTIFTEGAMP